MTSASQASAASFVMKCGTRRPPLRFSRGSSAVAGCPASESDPTATQLELGVREDAVERLLPGVAGRADDARRSHGTHSMHILCDLCRARR